MSNLQLQQSPCALEQLSSMNDQISSKHPCIHAFSYFCLFANDLFFSFWHKQIWTEFMNMVTVEASVMSLVFWNMNGFWREKDLCLSAKPRPLILNYLQPHIPMCTCNWSYFEALYHSIHDVSPCIWVRIVNKTPGQKHLWENSPGKFLEEEIPLKNIHQIKCNYLQISLGMT